MKNVTVKALLAIAAMALSGSVFAAQVLLNVDGQRSGSGTAYARFFDGSDGMPADTDVIWNWDGTVLSMTGTHQANRYLGNNPAGSYIDSDKVTNLTIDTTNLITSASQYFCIEGTFNLGTGVHGCADVLINAGGYESTMTYNVGGDAGCITRTINGDDTSAGNPRGLYANSAHDACNAQSGAYDMWDIVQDNLGTGGTLIIANNGLLALSCYNAPATKDGACAGAQWMTFSPVPVPAAAWLFGSALGLLGWIRRRAMA